MKILHVIQRYPPAIGGAEFWCKETSRYLAAKGYNITVLTLDVYNEDEYWSDPPPENCILRFGRLEYDGKIKIIRCKRTKVPRFASLFFRGIDRLFRIYLYGPHSIELYYRMIRKIKETDIVHLHVIPYPHNFLALFLAKLFKKRVVITPHFHKDSHHYETKANYWLMKRCDAVFAVTDYERGYLISKGLNNEKVFVAYNTIEPNNYEAKELEDFKRKFFKKYDIREGTKIVIFIGRKIEYKRVDTLIEAVKILRKNVPIKLFLVGPNFPWFQEYYSKLSEEDKKDIIDLEVVPHQAKVNLLHLSDLLVLPSKFEAFGIVFLEAWSCGVPVIGVKNAIMSEVIGKAGLTFKMADIDSLKESIKRLLYDEALRRSVIDEGNDKVMNKFNIHTVGRSIANVYSPKKTTELFDIEGFLEKGWYPIEKLNNKKWVWSKKEACLKFPAGHSGYSLKFTEAPIGDHHNIKIFYNNKMYAHLSPRDDIDISLPRGTRSCRIVSKKSWIPSNIIPGSSDGRELGVCLHKMASSCIYSKTHHDGIPQFFEMALSGICNINPPCVMCSSRNDKNRKIIPYISKNILEKIIPYLNLSEQILVCGGEGEPLLSRDLFEILNKVDTKNVRVFLGTNGLLLTKEVSKKLLEAGLGRIDISIDAANPLSYKKIRNNDGFDLLIDNIRQLNWLKEEMGVRYPEIFISMVIMKENLMEMPAFVELADSLGIKNTLFRIMTHLKETYIVDNDDFRFNYLDQRIGPDSKELKELIDVTKEKAKRYCINLYCDNSIVRGLLNDKTEKKEISYDHNEISFVIDGEIEEGDLHFKQIDLRCKRPWESVYVELNGDVKFCCHSEQVLGNLNDTEFLDIWNGEVSKYIRESFLNDRLPKGCLTCTVI